MLTRPPLQQKHYLKELIFNKLHCQFMVHARVQTHTCNNNNKTNKKTLALIIETAK